MPGVLFHGKETISIEGEKDFSLVYPADINDRLTVVGTLQEPQDLRFTHAFKWSNNQLEILEALGGAYSSATAVNAAGDVVGSAQTASARATCSAVAQQTAPRSRTPCPGRLQQRPRYQR